MKPAVTREPSFLSLAYILAFRLEHRTNLSRTMHIKVVRRRFWIDEIVSAIA